MTEWFPMSDTLITVFLNLFLICMTALGIYVSFVPLDTTDKLHHRRRSLVVVSVFVCLTVLIITLSTVQTRRTGAQQEAANAKISALARGESAANDKLVAAQINLQSSLLEEEFMKGQLDALGRRVTTLDYDNRLASANNAAVLQEMRDAQNEQLSHLPALQRMSNKDLKETVHVFSRRLGGEGRNLERLDDEIAANQRRYAGVTNPSNEQQKELADIAARKRAWNNALMSTINNEGNLAIAYRNELIRRLGRDVVPQLSWPTEDNKPLREERIFSYAQYLDNLAQEL